MAIAGITLVFPSSKLAAQNSPANISEAPPPIQAAPVQLSPSAAEVLKLTHAQVGEDTIVAYVANSGKIYSMGVSEILYLHKEGVPDRVLAAMLNHQAKPGATAPLAPAPTAYPAQPYAYPPSTANYAPTETTPSTVYVTQPDYSSYSYPYYYPYYYGYPYYYSSWSYWPYYYPCYYGGCYYHGHYYCGNGYYGHGYYSHYYPWHGGGHWGGGIHATPSGGGSFHTSGFSGGVRMASMSGGSHMAMGGGAFHASMSGGGFHGGGGGFHGGGGGGGRGRR